MKGSSIIRWKFVLPAGILVAAIAVFFVLFFDPIVERAIEKVASRVNGAKVEIDGLKTKFFKGRVDVARLQVTDRESPMRNVVETGALAFQLDPSEAARMRFIVNDAALHGLRFNTERASSGAMPRLERKAEDDGPPGPAEKLAKKYAGRFKVSLAGVSAEAKKRIEFDPKETEVVKRSEALQARAEAMPEEWETRVDNLKAEERLDRIEADLESIKKTPTDGAEAFTAIPQAIKKLGQVKADINKLRDDVSATRKSVVSDVRSFRQGILSLNAARSADVENLMSRFNLDFADPKNLMESVIGPVVLDRFRTVLKYVEIARKHMPSKKEKASVAQRPRADGTDVMFPTPAAPPRFWLRKAALDGSYQDIAAEGVMSDLTTDPARAGRPFKLSLSGQKAAQRYSLQATLDHVTDVPRDSFVMKAGGIDVASVTGASAEMMTGGSATAEIAFSVVGDGGLGGGFRVGMKGVKLDRTAFLKQFELSPDDEAFKVRFADSLLRSIESLPEIVVDAQLYGNWSDPSLRIGSNLTSAFAGVVKSSVGNLVKDQRAELEARLEKITAQEKAKLNAQAEKLEGKLNERIRAIESRVDQKVSEASGIKLGAGGSGLKVPGLDKLFK